MALTELEQTLFAPIQRLLKQKTVYVLKDCTHEDPRVFKLYRIQDGRPHYVTHAKDLKRFITRIKIIAQITDENIEHARVELAEIKGKKEASREQFESKKLWWQKDD